MPFKLETATIVAVLGALLTVAGAVWQFGHRDAILDDHERRIKTLEATVAKESDVTNTMTETLARIDERLKFLIEQFGKGALPTPARR